MQHYMHKDATHYVTVTLKRLPEQKDFESVNLASSWESGCRLFNGFLAAGVFSGRYPVEFIPKGEDSFPTIAFACESDGVEGMWVLPANLFSYYPS